MTTIIRCIFLILITFVLVISWGNVSHNNVADAKTTFVTIGTGGITGVYYPTGGAISRMINAKRKQYQIRALVESTAGSVHNINALMEGRLEFGIAQSDRQYQAWNGLAEWQTKGRQKKLRAVFSIHSESITIIASEKSRIQRLEDLKGKRINIGNIGSGQRQNAIDILKVLGLNYHRDIQAEEFKAEDAPKYLQRGGIDAFFYTVGHPSGAIKEVTSGDEKVRFIPIIGHDIDNWITKVRYYTKSKIPVSYYPRIVNREDVPTVGVKATFVTSIEVPTPVVYAVVKEVFDNLDEFKRMHPSYSLLTRKGMLEGLTAPIHPGALKYYLERGLKP